MGPEISTNVGSMLRAMENVVMPAIDAENKLAQEQGYLIMVYLRLLADQHDKIFHFRLQEIREYHALVADMLGFSAASGSNIGALEAAAQQALNEAAPLLTLALPSYEQLAEIARNLRETADQLTRAIVENSGSNKAVSDGFADLLLKQANREALRERAWVAGMGFDPQPQALPPLAELLSDTQK